VITRQTGYLSVRPAEDDGREASRHLEDQGFVLLRSVLDADEIAELEADIDRVFAEEPPDIRRTDRPPERYAPFRYAMLNRSAPCQRVIGHPAILEVIEPLLGEDCHVIANTAWRQEPGDRDHAGYLWHIDSGPHVPRPADVPWDPRIPYPIFAIAAHIYVHGSPIECGPTGVIPGSHRSGQAPPLDRVEDDDLTWNGIGAVPITAQAGDIALFVSDTWHRRLPSRPGDPGRYFLQCHYGRRDLAPRLRLTSEANQLSEEAIERATTRRERSLIGLHHPGFYDA
jgi:ectoine hydroxylase-related dioxygenase (phytanoyl-CoA dioxygenase family)